MWKTIEEVTSSPNLPPPSKQTWLSTDTWKLIQDRKALKIQGLSNQAARDGYSELNRVIQFNCRRDKNNFIKRICREIEEHALKTQCSDLFKKVKLLSKQFTPKTWVIDDENGNPLQDLDSISDRWRQYCANLYRNPQENSLPHLQTDWNYLVPESSILRSEIIAAVATLKIKKAPGPDQLTAEILKAIIIVLKL